MGVLELLNNFITSSISQWGYPAIFLLMMLSSICIPIPSEIVLLFAGYLAFQGKLSIIAVILWGTLGNLSGSVIAYYIGLKGGRPLFLRYGRYVFIKERELQWAEHWFARFGHETVFFGRMVPVIRAFISLPAGVAEMNVMKFNVYTVLGVLPWSVGLAYAGYLLGANWDTITKYFRFISWGVAAILAVAVAVFVFYHFRVRPKRT